MYRVSSAHTCELLAGKCDGKEPVGRSELMWKDNIKMFNSEIVCKGLSGRLAAGKRRVVQNAMNVFTIIGFSVNLYQLKSWRLHSFRLRSEYVN
jgi:hypothetical protein